MEMYCPDCMGTLTTSDGKTARCDTHGGDYTILFSSWKPPAPVVPDEPLSPVDFQFKSGMMCHQHPAVSASFVCRNCGTPLCELCAFADEQGNRFCPGCISRRTPSASGLDVPPRISIPAGVHCVQHPNVDATQICKSCGAYMCATCDFALPGGIHICPACAAAPKTTLSRKRKKLLSISYVLAAWSTLVFTALLAGYFAKFVKTKDDVQMVGIMLLVFLLGPSLAGLAMACSALEKRLTNPPSLWIAVIWNGLITGGFILLDIIGLMK